MAERVNADEAAGFRLKAGKTRVGGAGTVLVLPVWWVEMGRRAGDAARNALSS